MWRIVLFRFCLAITVIGVAFSAWSIYDSIKSHEITRLHYLESSKRWGELSDQVRKGEPESGIWTPKELKEQTEMLAKAMDRSSDRKDVWIENGVLFLTIPLFVFYVISWCFSGSILPIFPRKQS